MPLLDGFDATRMIRALEQSRGSAHMPIIAVTASAMDDDRQRCMVAGMDEVMCKPFSRDKVQALLQRVAQAAVQPV